MKKYRDYIKERKIHLDYFVKETGYSKPYISTVLNGKKIPSHAFMKIFKLAFKKKLDFYKEDLDFKKEFI